MPRAPTIRFDRAERAADTNGDRMIVLHESVPGDGGERVTGRLQTNVTGLASLRRATGRTDGSAHPDRPRRG